MSCPTSLRYMGGSTKFVPASNSVVTVASPVTLPTSGFAVSFWYKTYTQGGFGTDSNTFANDQGWFVRDGSIKYARQGTNDCQVYAYLDAPTDFATPRRLRFRNFYQPNGDLKWHHRLLNIYVENGSAKCDEYEDGIKLGATHTVDYTGDATTPTGNLLVGRANQTFNGLMAEVRFYPTLTLEQIRQIAKHGSCGVEPLQDHPLSDLPSTYLDTVGGATGTGTATTYSTDVPTQQPVALDMEAKSSLSFRTADANIDLGSSIDNSLATTGVFTIQCEVMPALLNTFQTIVSFGGGGVGKVELHQRTANNFGARLTDGSNVEATFDVPVAKVEANTWQDVVLKYSDDLATLYKDGQKVGTKTYTGITIADGINRIGVRPTTNDDFFGNIKTVRTWNTALTDQQIRDLHFSNAVPTDGLVLNLKLNEGAGTIAYDSSGNGNNGTISGATWSAQTPTKAPVQIGGNLVKNGDFSYVPVVNVATTVNNRWIDGTAAGSTNVALYKKLFGWRLSYGGTGESMFDGNSLKLSTKAVASYVEARHIAESYNTSINEGFVLNPNTQYILTFKLRTNYVSGDSGSGAFMRVNMANGAGVNTQESLSTPVKITTSETVKTVTFTTGSTIRRGHLEACIYGYTGTATLIMDAWFSDISLTEVSPTTHLPVSGTTQLTCP